MAHRVAFDQVLAKRAAARDIDAEAVMLDAMSTEQMIAAVPAPASPLEDS